MTGTLARFRLLGARATSSAILDNPERAAQCDDEKPRWRGVLHEKAFAVSPAVGLLLVSSATGARAVVAAAVYATTMTAMLGASALNHRAAFGPRWQERVHRLDHAAINVAMAGTWTPIALVALSGTSRLVLTSVVWGGVALASVIQVAWVRAPAWVASAIALGLGWTAAFALPQMAAALSPVGVVLFVAGGLFCTAGAIVYALRRPDPAPESFGYHEVFHALVLAGVICHYVTIGFFVLPLA